MIPSGNVIVSYQSCQLVVPDSSIVQLCWIRVRQSSASVQSHAGCWETLTLVGAMDCSLYCVSTVVDDHSVVLLANENSRKKAGTGH